MMHMKKTGFNPWFKLYHSMGSPKHNQEQFLNIEQGVALEHSKTKQIEALQFLRKLGAIKEG